MEEIKSLSKIKNPFLSIIVPVYNVEKYLGKCLDTMLKQEDIEYEIIIVNDGTKDNSEEIINEKIRENGDKITYIVKENGGLSDARNMGLKYANGRYIAFFDSDDYINPQMYKKMKEKTDEYPYDIVVCSLYEEYEEEDEFSKNKLKKVNHGIDKDYQLISIEDRKKLMKEIYIAVHNKIYKKEILDQIPFIKGMKYEDIVFTYKLMGKIESIAKIDEPLYYYMQRKGSISKTYGDSLYDILESTKILNEYYKEIGKFEEFKDILEYITVRYSFGTFFTRYVKIKDKEKVKLAYTRAKNNIYNNFPEFKKNKYLNESNGLKDSIKNYLLKNMTITKAKLLNKLRK